MPNTFQYSALNFHECFFSNYFIYLFIYLTPESLGLTETHMMFLYILVQTSANDLKPFHATPYPSPHPNLLSPLTSVALLGPKGYS